MSHAHYWRIIVMDARGDAPFQRTAVVRHTLAQSDDDLQRLRGFDAGGSRVTPLYRIKVTPKSAERIAGEKAVRRWRAAHPEISAAWREIAERAG